MIENPDPVMEKASMELDQLLYSLNDSMIILEDFQEEKRESLYEHLQGVIRCFQSLKNMTPTIKETVPRGVIQMLDQGKDPNEFAKNLVACVNESHERVRKKQTWMQHLKESLDGLISANFPDEKPEEIE